MSLPPNQEESKTHIAKASFPEIQIAKWMAIIDGKEQIALGSMATLAALIKVAEQQIVLHERYAKQQKMLTNYWNVHMWREEAIMRQKELSMERDKKLTEENVPDVYVEELDDVKTLFENMGEVKISQLKSVDEIIAQGLDNYVQTMLNLSPSKAGTGRKQATGVMANKPSSDLNKGKELSWTDRHLRRKKNEEIATDTG